jgi:hypothetical protein
LLKTGFFGQVKETKIQKKSSAGLGLRLGGFLLEVPSLMGIAQSKAQSNLLLKKQGRALR